MGSSPDLPMFEMTIKVFGWERGQAEVDTSFLDALGGLFDESADDRDAILGEIHVRVREEMAEAFEILRRVHRAPPCQADPVARIW